MCGIAGVWSDGRPEEARAAVRAMMAALRHRGPDAEGMIEVSHSFAKSGRQDRAPSVDGDLTVSRSKECLVLGHTRLSILDLSDSARQPMHDARTDSWLVFNGEIYNFRELRRELEREGARFATTGDSEVLLQVLVRWGPSALDKLEGMFAFAFWNGRERALLIARDRLGVKPLYYRTMPAGFAFASEVKALERAGLGTLTLDPEAVESFLAYGAVIGPNTIYREIRELEPGHLLRISGGNVEQRGYWVLSHSVTSHVVAYDDVAYSTWAQVSPTNGRTLRRAQGRPWATGFEQSVETVRERLADAVDSHLISDVPVGVFLSGGVDSSLLALLASERAKSPITLLTVAFAEQEFSELPYAQQIARDLPHHHEVVTLTAEQLREQLPAALAAMDQPTVDGINTYVISRVGASLGLKVLLSGVGGDELFGGYTTFVKAPRLLRYGAGMRPAARVLAKLGSGNAVQWKKVADSGRPANLAEAYLLQRSVRWTPETRSALAARLQPAIDPLANDFQKIAALELGVYMRNQLLRDADVFSMANSVELRVPFLDKRLVETALAISPKHHFEGATGKRIPRRILGELTKQGSARRRKMGFTFPWQRWLQSSLKNDIAKTLGDRRLYEPLALDPSYGRQLLTGLERGERTQSWLEVWSLFVLLNWQARTGVECAVA